MTFNKLLTVFLFAFVLLLSSFSEQYKPRIAVMPFNPIGVSKNDAQVVTGLFETGLVKTDSFNVIEQQQINEILSVQAFTLTGCTDDACAIEFGKLLAAEQVVFGDFSTLGGKFILNVKIIDVELGRNIKADSVETSRLSEMSAAAELLAFKLAGLTYTKGQSLQIADAFRDVFIETEPTGADIYINGVKKGISPGLFEQVPLGNIIIEARKDSLYGRTETRITEKTNSLNIRLKETYGNLLIKSTVKDIDVYLDDVLFGKLDSGFFTDITVGEHELVLDSDGYYWKGNVSIIANKSVTVTAEPKPYGVLQYTIQDGVIGELSDLSGAIGKLTLNGDITLSTGDYTVKLSGDNYEPEVVSIEITRGKKFLLYTALKHNREYVLSGFTEGVKYYSEFINSSSVVTMDSIQSLEDLQKEITSSRFLFDDLENEVTVLLEEFNLRKNRQDKIARLEEIIFRRTEIEDEIIRLNRVDANKKLGGWISAGSSVLSAGLFGLFSILGNNAYDNYAAATISADAVEYKKKVQLWDTLSYISLGTAAAGAGLSAYLFLSKSPIEELNGEYVSLGIEMARLEGELQ